MKAAEWIALIKDEQDKKYARVACLEVLREASTAELISELETRRLSGCPNKCEYLGSEFCGACIWGAFIGEEKGAITDNFKEIKHD